MMILDHDHRDDNDDDDDDDDDSGLLIFCDQCFYKGIYNDHDHDHLYDS